MSDSVVIQPPLTLCLRCGQYNHPAATQCLFCRAPLLPPSADDRPCPRCGQLVPTEARRCARCDAGLSFAPPPVVQTAPHGLAAWGYGLLIGLGGLITLMGLGLLAWTQWIQQNPTQSAAALSLILTGLALFRQSERAFQPARWQPMSLWPMWFWPAAWLLVWGVGGMVMTFWRGIILLALPPLLVVAALIPSFLFVRATLGGLRRRGTAATLAPRHVVYLCAASSSWMSVGLALVLESILTGVILAALLLFVYFTRDHDTFQQLIQAARNMTILDQLERMIAVSPPALAALVSLMVIGVPLIEEVVKGLPLLWWGRRVADQRTAILLGVACGAGFAFAENVGYIGMLAESWWMILWFRAAAAVMHGAASGFVGRGWYHIRQRHRRAAWADFGRAVAIHVGWNALALLVGWFGYRGQSEGMLLTIVAGLLPLAVLFTILAWRGFWVSE